MGISQLKLDLIQQVLHTQDEALLHQLLIQLQQAKIGTDKSLDQDLLHALLQNTAESKINQSDIEDIQRSISDVFDSK